VLDASVTMAWCFVDEDDDYAQTVLRELSETTIAIVPDNWRYEVANALLVACRRKRLDGPRSLSFMAMLRGLPISEGDVRASPEALFDTGRRYGLESYDAAYLHLAVHAGLPLATGDARLRRAARKARVSLFSA
jgi:predicted nucleic acid-binding protein